MYFEIKSLHRGFSCLSLYQKISVQIRFEKIDARDPRYTSTPIAFDNRKQALANPFLGKRSPVTLIATDFAVVNSSIARVPLDYISDRQRSETAGRYNAKQDERRAGRVT